MYDYENSPETALIRKARHGDIRAFETLYRRIYKELYQFALYTMRQPQEAEDVVSEAVISAYENLHKLRKEESFRSWIFTIVANQCKKHFRTEKRNEPLTGELTAQEQDFAQMQDVRAAFLCLDEEDRMIVACSVLGGYPSEEIGKMIQMNPATVRSRKARALEKMRRMIE